MAQGHGFPRQTYDEHEGFSSAIAVGSDVVSSEGIVFRLRPGASISGSVTDDFNDVVRNASVTLFHSGVFNGKQMTTMAQQVNTDDQGHYHFGHLPSGNYFVAVSAQPWYAQNGPRFQMVSTTTRSADGTTRTTQRQVEQTSDSVKDPLDVAYPITFYAGTTEKGSATSIVVKPGDHAEADVTITAVPAVHLHIQQAGAPTNDSYSTLSQHLFGNFSVPVPAQTFRNSRGDLELRGVAPGQFTLDSQINGPNPVTSSQEITVYQNGEIGAAKLSPSITVHGVVTMDGKPVSPGVFVQLRSDNTGYGNRVSDKGEFQISEPIKPGSYEIVIFGITGGAIISSVTRDTLPAVDGNRIELNGSGPVQLDIKLARGLGKIEGLAVKDGKPFPGAMVVLVPEDFERHKSFVRRDQSDGDGTFTLAGAAPGKYKVVAIQNGWSMEWTNPTVLKPYLKTAESLEVAANQKYTVKVPVQ